MIVDRTVISSITVDYGVDIGHAAEKSLDTIEAAAEDFAHDLARSPGYEPILAAAIGAGLLLDQAAAADPRPTHAAFPAALRILAAHAASRMRALIDANTPPDEPPQMWT